MGFWQRTEKRIRDFFAKRGYTCDSCGVEIFDYPQHRICSDCERSLIRPHGNTCKKCGRKKTADGICLDCKGNLPKFTRGFSPFVYQDKVAALVNRMKNGNPRIALYFGEEIATHFAENYLKTTPTKEELIIVPVPLTKNKRRERGYNQSERLAESITERLQAMGYSAVLDTELLQKRKDTAPQKQMTYVERMENVSGAYHVHKRAACRDKTVLLIDDVMTTGATASECAARLFGAGAKAVFFLAAAALEERKI